ncbi:hypothetical protein EW093_03950 [Thiospirochaeta perfilievii]|uniref:Dinitrogenase iron-molybdenum cofactor biosynthesis domain-containing protein n=1 Tax=Thiospirochaeta perfilievii TaxID=252967 RepID=A0A5C1Q8X3_9SPIO|nr:NifB/NifX family molybdenum-iron cluster-binding protein [Thiospirochaeta perfilievii]QEN03887.1 hypothetical protein EW093_03950 [Thiospirochaeta perfilievii]
MIAIPVVSKKIKSNISICFGRCNYFAVVDDNGQITFLENKCKNSPAEAGIIAVKLLLENNIKIIISSNIGSTTKSYLKNSSITVYDAGNLETADKALSFLKLNKLVKMI